MEKRTITLSNGRQVEMRLTDEFDEITFYENGKKLSGEFQFIMDDENESKYLLGRMYSPIPYHGLGEAALRFFIDITDAFIWTRPHDGIPLSDGTHLTGDAPSFVGKMQRIGLIETPKRDDFDYDDF